MQLIDKIRAKIRDVPDFPKEGIVFKDITPILSDAGLSKEITRELHRNWSEKSIDAVVGIETRGFLFGMLLAYELDVPFIPVRKSGKLPYRTIKHSYDLEYGSATLEVHQDAILPDWKVLIHDDLLATGGTAEAAAELVRKLNGKVEGFSFLIDLTFLNGSEMLKSYTHDIQSMVQY